MFGYPAIKNFFENRDIISKFGGASIYDMIYLALPPHPARRLPFYLSVEEWVARNLPDEEYFFAWRVSPTVICGRNQDMAREVDLDYCSREGIDVVRRRSGGGAVYADMDNFMFSYITPGDKISATFSRYTTMIARMLGAIGIEAEVTGRNDLLINGAKVAGNAFYHLPGKCIVHGTMLYDFDPSRMMRAITPSRAKLESKGVVSAAMRVTSLKAAGISMTIDEFGAFAVKYLCGDNVREITVDDIAEIEEIEKKYYDPGFILGRSAGEANEADIYRHMHIGGVGEFDVAINLNPDRTIEGVGLWGDFFVTGDMADILAPLEGVAYNRRALSEAIKETDPENIIAGLNRKNLLNLLI